MIITGLVEHGLVKGFVNLRSTEGTELSWTDPAGKVAENVAEGTVSGINLKKYPYDHNK